MEAAKNSLAANRLHYGRVAESDLYTLSGDNQTGCSSPSMIRIKKHPEQPAVTILSGCFLQRWSTLARLQPTTRFRHWYYFGAYQFDNRPSLVIIRFREKFNRLDLFVFPGYHPGKGERNRLLAQTARAWKSDV